MDALFAKLFLTNELFLIGLMFALFVAGAVVAARVLTVKASFRRVTYFFSMVGLSFLMSVSQLGWNLLAAAATAGLFSALMIALLGSFFAYGMVNYFASAARSNNICGTTKKAWMGFVPIVNLVLALSSPTASHEAKLQPRSTFSRFILTPLMIVAGIGLIVATRGVDKQFEEMMEQTSQDTAALEDILKRAQSVAQSFAAIADATQPDLPYRVDDQMVLTATTATGKTLQLTYEVTFPATDFATDLDVVVAHENCAPDDYGFDINRGGSLIINFDAPDGERLRSVTITADDCVF